MSSVSISIAQQTPPPGSSPRTLAFGGSLGIRGQAKRIFRSCSIQVSIGGTIVNLSAAINSTQWSCAAEPGTFSDRLNWLRLCDQASNAFFNSGSSDLRTKYAEPRQRGHAILVMWLCRM